MRDATPAVDHPAPVVPGSVGILGGTFDPIHYGHLAIAEEAREALGLERVLFVPAAAPPHKPGQPVTAPEHRLAMVRIAMSGNGAFEANDIEIRRGGPSYTVDTLDQLGEAGIAEPWLILSSEALAQLATWRDPHRILQLARLAVLPRAGSDLLGPNWVGAAFPDASGRVRFLPGPLLPISGSVVRRRVAAGRSIRYLVPEAVAAYIAQHALYR